MVDPPNLLSLLMETAFFPCLKRKWTSWILSSLPVNFLQLSEGILPFEDGALAPTVRKIRAYVTLERVIKYSKSPVCRGCDRVAEGVPHSDECRERFRVLLEKHRAIPSTPAPSTPVPSAPVVPAVVRQDASLRSSTTRDVNCEGGQGWWEC